MKCAVRVCLMLTLMLPVGCLQTSSDAELKSKGQPTAAGDTTPSPPATSSQAKPESGSESEPERMIDLAVLTDEPIVIPLELKRGVSLLAPATEPVSIQLSDSAPASLRSEPDPAQARRYYAEVQLPFGGPPVRFPLVVDISPRQSKLFMDCDGDGRCEAEAEARGNRFSCEVMLLPADAPENTNVGYALRLSMADVSAREPSLAAYLSCYRTARVSIGGQVREFVVVDTNRNGIYSDDVVMLDANRDRKLQPDEVLQVGEVLVLENQAFSLAAISESGDQLTFSPWKASPDGAASPVLKTPEVIKGSNLAAARRGFRTSLKLHGPAPQQFFEISPPDGVREITYTSGELELKAWVTSDQETGEKLPAVVFLHGGWAFAPEDWQDAAGFAEHGFVVMTPMLRGENGNPGTYECFLGEVDDAIAAGRFVADLSYVDDRNVFLAGHSVGAVLTSLAAMQPSPYRAAAALSGYLDMRDWAANESDERVVFNQRFPDELRLRNPLEFVRSLQIPITLYCEREVLNLGSARFAQQAQQFDKSCSLVVVPGDHSTMVAPAVTKAAKWFHELSQRD